jgi:hypothetical protein
MNATTTTSTGPAHRPRETWAAAHDAFRKRRQARREYRALARDLSLHTSTHQIDDLLAAVDRQDSGDALVLRTILSTNR